MRRFFILGLLFLLMLALPTLQIGAETPFDPLSLATFGFILLAAYTLGETAGRFGLPKITGYIVTGVLFGPYVIDLFSEAVVSDLKVINGLAIGMIALSAGGEMILSSLRQIARSLTLIVLVKGLLILAAIMGAVYVIQPMLPFLAEAPTPLVLAVGGLFGVLAIGTSPAATIAVINETGAKGRLTDTTLGVAVFKDVVMVILLAVFLALANVFSTPDAVFDPGVLTTVGLHLVEELLAGVVLGVVIILYMKYIGAEMWLFLLAAIFGTNAFGQFFELEVLLTFIMAGFVVQNFSKYGHDFVHIVESVALPVYVVFFSVTGAGLNLGALVQVGLVALILVVVRLGAIFAGTGLATRLANEPAAIRKNAWMAFVSQAGVVIGLAIIITNSLPGLGAEIQTVVLGTVALNLIIGPILFKLALARVGETAEARGAADAAPEAVAEPGEEAALPAEPLPELPERIAFPEPAFAAPRLQGAAQTVLARLATLRQDFSEEVLARQTAALADELAGFRALYGEQIDGAEDDLRRAPDAAAQARALRAHRTALADAFESRAIAFGHRTDLAEAGRAAFEALFETLAAIPRALDEKAEVLIEPERLRAAPGDTFVVRLWKAVKRAGGGLRSLFGSGLPPMRTVPIRRVARYQLEGRLPERLVPVASRTAAHPAYAIEKVRVVFRQLDEQLAAAEALLVPDGPGAHVEPLGAEVLAGIRTAADAEFEQAAADLRRFADEAGQRFAFELAGRYEALLSDFAEAGTINLPDRRRRFSRVVEGSHRARRKAVEAFAAWQRAQQGLAAALAKHLVIVRLDIDVREAVEAALGDVGEHIREEVGALIERAAEACREAGARLDGALEEATTDEARQQAMTGAAEWLAEAFERQALDPLEDLRERRTLNARLDVLLGRLGELAAELPEVYELVELDELPPLDGGAVPSEVKMRAAPLREAARSFLETRATRNLAGANQTLLREVDTVLATLFAVEQQVRFNLQAAAEALGSEAGGEGAANAAFGALDRARHRLEDLHAQVLDFDATAHRQITEATRGLLDPLEADLAGRTGLTGKLQREQEAALSKGASALVRAGRVVRERYRLVRRSLSRWLRPFAREVLREVRARRSLDELAPEEVLDRYDQAALSAAHVEHLPFIYQKLFALDPLETDDFLVGRAEEAETVRLALRRWQTGVACSVAVTGEPGAGVSSFLGVLRRMLPPEPAVATIRFPHAGVTEEGLAKRLAAAFGVPQLRSLSSVMRYVQAGALAGPHARRFVVVLEDVHHLYRRAPGGFTTLQQLALMIAETGAHVFWIASMNRHAWRYLDAVVGLGDAFALAVPLSALGRAEVEEVVERRHRLSGLDLAFAPAPILEQRRRYQRADEAGRQALARKEFFDQLHRVSGGNPLAVLFHWLKSIGEVHDDGLVIGPLARPSFGYVRSLDPVELFTLRVVLQQGSLAADAHARLFGLPPATSQTILARLAQLNLLAPAPGTNGSATAFRIHRPAYRPLAGELRALNLID